jgi:hypothetical protein
MSAAYAYDPLVARVGGRWPNGRGLAVYVAVGAEAYRSDPQGHAESLLEGMPAPDLVNDAWRGYGNRVGAFRLLNELEEAGLPATLLLNTLVYDEAPAVTDAARRVGAEVVGHGVSNSDSLADMTAAEQQLYLESVASRIEREEGTRPGGWSSPWLAHREDTLDALAAAGYRYLLDLRPDDQPFWLATTPDPLLVIPYALELNDSTTMIGRGVGATDFAEMVVDEFDELLGAAEEFPLVMSVVLHSYISGVPFRLRQIRRALRHIAHHSDRVWLTQPAGIHAAFSELASPGDRYVPLVGGVPSDD